MNRPIFVCAIFLAAAATLGAQQASQSNPYEGTSNPPPDDTIITSTPTQAKPPAGHPYRQPAPAPVQPVLAAQPAEQPAPQPVAAGSVANNPAPDGDDGIVQVAPDTPTRPVLNQRAYAPDPDADIVHPPPLPPGELGQGTIIRARLLQRLSSSYNEVGDTFRTQVASDVVQDGQVLIPAGAEIDGRVTDISTGHLGGHGSMRLQPETVILPNGQHFRMYAEVTATPDSGTHVTGEGTVVAGARTHRDEIEYGGAIGAGAATGAIVAGPVGALTGSIIGAGVITTHLLVSHPQATLDTGTTLDFILNEPLMLVPSTARESSTSTEQGTGNTE
jgi:hypothetical protein